MSRPKVDAKAVIDLRKRTGVPLMECKEVLEFADGDAWLAEQLLRHPRQCWDRVVAETGLDVEPIVVEARGEG